MRTSGMLIFKPTRELKDTKNLNSRKGRPLLRRDGPGIPREAEHIHSRRGRGKTNQPFSDCAGTGVMGWRAGTSVTEQVHAQPPGPPAGVEAAHHCGAQAQGSRSPEAEDRVEEQRRVPKAERTSAAHCRVEAGRAHRGLLGGRTLGAGLEDKEHPPPQRPPPPRPAGVAVKQRALPRVPARRLDWEALRSPELLKESARNQGQPQPSPDNGSDWR